MDGARSSEAPADGIIRCVVREADGGSDFSPRDRIDLYPSEVRRDLPQLARMLSGSIYIPVISIEKFHYLSSEFEASSPALFEANDLFANHCRCRPDDPASAQSDPPPRSDVGPLADKGDVFYESREMCGLHVANLIDTIAAGVAATPSQDTSMRAKALQTAGMPLSGAIGSG